MADINNLDLLDDEVELAAELPEERGLRLPMLQPGVGIVFQLPASFDYEPFQLDSGQRLMVKFRDATILKVYSGAAPGTPVRTTISNMDQERKNKDGVKVKVNPWAYLLRSLGFKGELHRNKDYAQAMEQYKADYFGADWGWSANCSAKRDIYRGGSVIKGRTGCGQRYGDRTRTYTDRNGTTKTILAIPRNADGSWQEAFHCQGKRADGTPCDAEIFANGELSNFKPVARSEEGQ